MLYCVHAACTALDTNECDSAIVASANLIQSPEQHFGTMKPGVLSSTSTCHTFDASANGYGRGEGIGALYLKKLSKAIRDGDSIRSIIRWTAVNRFGSFLSLPSPESSNTIRGSNGKTPGIALPSVIGQENVIRKAYAKANIGFEETDYIECHGTGTVVGDPIEVEALSRVIKRTSDQPILIGSVSYPSFSDR